jgi:hypothetical protein
MTAWIAADSVAASGDALHAALCATGFNIRWLLRAISAKGLAALLLVLSQRALWQRRLASALQLTSAAHAALTRSFASRVGNVARHAEGEFRRVD